MDSEARRDEDVVGVEFRVSDPSYPFVDASQAADCRLELEVLFPHSDGGFVEYFTVDGAPPERTLQVIDRSDDVTGDVVARHADGGRLRLHVRDRCVAITVAEFGAIPRVVEAERGDGRVVADVASRSAVADLVERFEREHPTVSVDGCRRRQESTPLFAHHDFTQQLLGALTDRQREVFLTAYMNGYYDWPRKHEGNELAAELGISPATFSQHLRAAEGEVFSQLLDTDDECVFVE